mgnify:CR=1 FL=1
MPEEETKEPKYLTIDGKKYNLESLSDEAKNDLTGLRICESQLRLHQDTLKLLTISRQAITNQLKEKLKDIQPED